MIFKQGQVDTKIQGADPRKLQDAVKKLAAEAEGGSSAFGASGSGSNWRTGDLPRGYSDVTDQVDLKGLELLNADSEFGGVRVLVDPSKPTGLQKGKAAAGKEKDWVESDTDEQLMLFMPFQSTLKVHTVQVKPYQKRLSLPMLTASRLPPSHLRLKTTKKSPCDQRQSKYTSTAHTSSDLKKQMIFPQPSRSHFQRRIGIPRAPLHYPYASLSSRTSQAWYCSL